METVFPQLAALRDGLAALPGVVTCKIGLEANMTPADYPMIRIVPSAIDGKTLSGDRAPNVLIYFGQPIHEFTDGLESLWEELLAMEAQIATHISSVQPVAVYLDTILDEDRSDAYKLLAIRARVMG